MNHKLLHLTRNDVGRFKKGYVAHVETTRSVSWFQKFFFGEKETKTIMVLIRAEHGGLWYNEEDFSTSFNGAWTWDFEKYLDKVVNQMNHDNL